MSVVGSKSQTAHDDTKAFIRGLEMSARKVRNAHFSATMLWHLLLSFWCVLNRVNPARRPDNTSLRDQLYVGTVALGLSLVETSCFQDLMFSPLYVSSFVLLLFAGF